MPRSPRSCASPRPPSRPTSRTSCASSAPGTEPRRQRDTSAAEAANNDERRHGSDTAILRSPSKQGALTDSHPVLGIATAPTSCDIRDWIRRELANAPSLARRRQGCGHLIQGCGHGTRANLRRARRLISCRGCRSRWSSTRGATGGDGKTVGTNMFGLRCRRLLFFAIGSLAVLAPDGLAAAPRSSGPLAALQSASVHRKRCGSLFPMRPAAADLARTTRPFPWGVARLVGLSSRCSHAGCRITAPARAGVGARELLGLDR